MKFNCGPTFHRSIEWYKDAVAKAREWNDHFCWWPTRIAENDCRWLETVQRRCVGGAPWAMAVWDKVYDDLTAYSPFTIGYLCPFWWKSPDVEYRPKPKAADGA